MIELRAVKLEAGMVVLGPYVLVSTEDREFGEAIAAALDALIPLDALHTDPATQRRVLLTNLSRLPGMARLVGDVLDRAADSYYAKSLEADAPSTRVRYETAARQCREAGEILGGAKVL